VRAVVGGSCKVVSPRPSQRQTQPAATRMFKSAAPHSKPSLSLNESIAMDCYWLIPRISGWLEG